MCRTGEAKPKKVNNPATIGGGITWIVKKNSRAGRERIGKKDGSALN
jgi:hypothetical protein